MTENSGIFSLLYILNIVRLLSLMITEKPSQLLKFRMFVYYVVKAIKYLSKQNEVLKFNKYFIDSGICFFIINNNISEPAEHFFS